MAKLNRENRLRDKRAAKKARKTARKLSAETDGAQAAWPADESSASSGELDTGDPAAL